MSFRSVYAPALGIGSLSTPFSSRSQFRIFELPTLTDNEPTIDLSTYTGAFLGSIALDVQNTILKSFEFRYGDTGSIDCKFELNSESDIPLIRFTDLIFSIGPTEVFRGYIWKSPGPEKKAEDSWKYSGKGMGSRLEKVNIALKENIDFYQIEGIQQDDDFNQTIIFVAGLSTLDVIGRVCIIQDADDTNNNGRFDIIDAGHDSGGDFISFVNPAGLSQDLSVGILYILPAEWSDPTTTFSNLIKQVVSNYCDDLPISTTTDFIDSSPSLLIGDVVDLDKMSVDEFFKQMRQLAPDWYLYVNANSQVIFKEKSNAPVAIALVGYDFHDVTTTLNEDQVVNRWFVNHKEGKDSDMTGFKNGGVAADLTSIKNFGLLEDSLDVPVYYGEGLCQALAEALLQQSKDARETITVKNAPFDYYQIGLWKIITQPRPQENTISECETTDGWTASSPSVIDLSVETANLVFGAGALRAEFDSDSDQESIVLDTDFTVIDPVYLRFWYRGSRIGQRMTFGFGEDDYLENTRDVYVYSTRWKRFDIPLEGVDLTRIKKIGLRIESPHDDDFFLIDQITIFSAFPSHKLLELIEVRAVAGDRRFCDLTFGVRPSRMDDYMAGIFRSTQSTKLALRM